MKTLLPQRLKLGTSHVIISATNWPINLSTRQSLKNHSAAKKPLLSADAKAKKACFTQAYDNWTTEEAQNAVFTDDSIVGTR